MRKILICGNPIDPQDSLPIKLQTALTREFPDIQFEVFDPTEELPKTEKEPVIIDTIHGIQKVEKFTSLQDFKESPRISPHDYDLYINLMLLQKIGKIKGFTIIGLPPHYSKKQALEKLKEILRDRS